MPRRFRLVIPAGTSSLETATELSTKDEPRIKFSLHHPSGQESTLSEDPLATQCELHATPGTDLWRKPPVESFNAPSLTTRIKTGTFKLARVTVLAPWTRLYDQGGLVLIWPRAGEGVGSENPPAAWIKTGIEFHDEQTNLSTVATPATSTSDWSLVPLSSNSVTLEIERERGDHGAGTSLWVYLVDHNQRRAVREITWAFPGERLDEDLYVGLYVARPTKLKDNDKDTEELAVQFTDFKLELDHT